MWIAKTVSEVRLKRRLLNGSVALVPTMGALHEGHIALIQRARLLADQVLVSIFVNPTQFGEAEDFEKYPRRSEQDLAMCRDAGVQGVFMPDTAEVYPPGFGVCDVAVPGLSNQLEGEHRPGHFEGVCRVVAKLLNMVQPNIACFGRKDYQQLRVIQVMVADLAMPVKIEEVPTVREASGLALSSRNRRLTPDDARKAIGLYKALSEAKRLVEETEESDPQMVESAMRQIMAASGIHIDYAQVRHPHTLGRLDCIEPQLTCGVVALVAGRVGGGEGSGGVRLIDNMMLGDQSHEQLVDHQSVA